MTIQLSYKPGQMLMLAMALLAQAGLTSQASAGEIRQHAALTVETGQATLVQLTEPAATIFVANPDVADIQIPTPGASGTSATQFLVLGKKSGTTTVYALMGNGTGTSYAVIVTHPNKEIGAAINKEVPNAHVDVSSAPSGITLSGSVASPRAAQRAKETARQYMGEKDNLNFNVSVAASTQVNLRVQVAEVSRQTNKNFGFNWGSIFNNGTIAVGLLTGRPPVTAFGNFVRNVSTDTLSSIGIGYKNNSGSVNISGLVDALEQEGLVTILAEPNLTASSGRTANFLAGGEFPIPISQGNQQISVEFKRFGVSVDFTPIVLDSNRLSIEVRPEVSELTDIGSVVIDSIKIPALAIRRAETTVELASGQSFAIAGLFQNNGSNRIEQYPWLGDVPILGALFRASRFQRNESELVIIVTPYIVQPAARTADLHLPIQGVVFASDIEQALLGRLTSSKGAAPPQNMPRLNSAAGFMLE
ncbi:MAG: type II and III secretion system protein family protein [Alphaproteobacteria bacterium]